MTEYSLRLNPPPEESSLRYNDTSEVVAHAPSKSRAASVAILIGYILPVERPVSGIDLKSCCVRSWPDSCPMRSVPGFNPFETLRSPQSSRSEWD